LNQAASYQWVFESHYCNVVSIRRTLLLSFLLVGLGPAALLTYLAFERAQTAMRNEIEHSIVVEATSLSTDVDRILFERLENSATWSRLEVMQDIRVGDVDKRLSAFLSELKVGYAGVYKELFATDNKGVRVASSDAALIGSSAPRPAGWTSARFPGTEITLDTQSNQTSPVTLAIRATVPAALSDSSPGELTLMFDWGVIQTLLDSAASNGRSVAILDQNGRVIACSATLRDAGLLMTDRLKAWVPQGPTSSATVRSGLPLFNDEVIVGVNKLHDDLQFRGFGWTTLVIEPLDTALAPVRRMAMIFSGLLLIVTLLTIVVALWATRVIGGPITALTAFTRRYMSDQNLEATPRVTGGEVGELTQSFVQMVEETARSRQKLIQASKLAALGEMSAVLAHEIRTPLGILRSSAQILGREPSLGPESRELIGFIESETTRLNGLISTMLDSSRLRPPKLTQNDLHQIIHSCNSMLSSQAQKKRVEVIEHLEASDPLLACDAEQMTQVILNLLLNAVQIVPAGGRIELKTQDAGAEVLIQIADNGPGIPESDRERVFEAFFFRREGGIGLGLAVVKQIIEAHQGNISAGRSMLGGALFQIVLPRQGGTPSQ
jgi:signal transduction histidine kinase